MVGRQGLSDHEVDSAYRLKELLDVSLLIGRCMLIDLMNQPCMVQHGGDSGCCIMAVGGVGAYEPFGRRGHELDRGASMSRDLDLFLPEINAVFDCKLLKRGQLLRCEGLVMVKLPVTGCHRSCETLAAAHADKNSEGGVHAEAKLI